MTISGCTSIYTALTTEIYTSGLMSPGWRFCDVEGFRNATRLSASDIERDSTLNSLGSGVKSTGVDPDFLCLGPSGS